MTTNSEAREPKDQREFSYYVPGRWILYITRALATRITSALAVAITVLVAIVVVLGGLWLAYTYLPANVFYIILAVLVADQVIGFVLRAILSRK